MLLLMLIRPPAWSIAPPASSRPVAALPLNVELVTVAVAPLLKMAPPLPEPFSPEVPAALLFENVLLFTVSEGPYCRWLHR